uniref:Uncharacterized protein n=1 Tax=Solanum tuberosum TaxID=4113 RepID=M1DH06_SOLTU
MSPPWSHLLGIWCDFE